MEIITKEEVELGIEVAPGVRYKNGRFVYDSMWTYVRIHKTEIISIIMSISIFVACLIKVSQS